MEEPEFFTGPTNPNGGTVPRLCVQIILVTGAGNQGGKSQLLIIHRSTYTQD